MKNIQILVERRLKNNMLAQFGIEMQAEGMPKIVAILDGKRHGTCSIGSKGVVLWPEAHRVAMCAKAGPGYVAQAGQVLIKQEDLAILNPAALEAMAEYNKRPEVVAAKERRDDMERFEDGQRRMQRYMDSGENSRG